eukprot:TRINITY_DN13918_c0_g1_i1.p1 TRINITY_DN13918_c0_g1~~TRINITY_DN13918_c0_g1_i1.p1  ORF type:complete len:299 (-),score=120.64 TRINITY_DN13918_c0_g1_i1:57-953(-)
MSSEGGFKEALKDIIAGSVGGIAQCLVGHPLDTIKVRLQTQSQVAPKYKGMADCFSITVKEEGFVGLYKGIQSPLIGLSFFNAIQFLSYGQIKSLVKSFDKNAKKGDDLTIKEYIVAGSLVGVVVTFVETPIDFLKSQLQVPGSRYNGVFDAGRQIAKARGLFPGWYQGLSATFIRDVPANAAYFGVYEFVKSTLKSPSEQSGNMAAWKVLVSGGVGGMAYWGFTFPLDVIKSSIQTDAINPAERKYKGWVDCASKIYRSQGTKGFFRGFTPCIIRSFPANAACFWAYEQSKRVISGL